MGMAAIVRLKEEPLKAIHFRPTYLVSVTITVYACGCNDLN